MDARTQSDDPALTASSAKAAAARIAKTAPKGASRDGNGPDRTVLVEHHETLPARVEDGAGLPLEGNHPEDPVLPHEADVPPADCAFLERGAIPLLVAQDPEPARLEKEVPHRIDESRARIGE